MNTLIDHLGFLMLPVLDVLSSMHDVAEEEEEPVHDVQGMHSMINHDCLL